MTRPPIILAGLALLLLAAALPSPGRAADTPRAATPAVPKPRSPCVASMSPSPGPGAIVYVRDCADAPEMVRFRGGDFRMGDLLGNGHDYERPVRTVHVAPFWIGRYEVTVAEWSACVKARACPAVPTEPGTADHPVTHVSWDAAQQYVAWLAQRTGSPYRLPSEAEWEYAARAGSDQQYTWGNSDAAICEQANSFDLAGRRVAPSWNWSVPCDDGFAGTAPVGSFPPNAWGVYDMVGNVWEWVADCWHHSYDGAPDSSAAWVTADCSKRVNRGGGWGNHPRTARISNRDGDRSTAESGGLGFRVARDAR